MKRFLSLLIAGIMCVSMYSCSREEDTYNDPDDDNDDTEYVETEPETEKVPEGDKDLEAQYNSALKLLKKEDYEGAYEAFKQCKGYKDADKYLECFVYLPREEKFKSYGGTHIVNYEYTPDRHLIKSVEKIVDVDSYFGYEEGEVIFTYEYDYEFDEDGRILNKIESYNEELSTYECEYDKFGNVIKYIYGGVTQWECEYEYDSSGNIICATTTYIITKHEYDIDGNLIKSITTDLDDGSYYITKYENGKAIEKVWKDVLNKNTLKCTFKYDDKGKLTEEVYIYDDSIVKYNYKYNKLGNIMNIDMFSNNVLLRIYSFEYDDSNRLTKMYSEDYYDGVILSTQDWFVFEYNSNGLITKTISSDGDTKEYSDFVLCYNPEKYSIIDSSVYPEYNNTARILMEDYIPYLGEINYDFERIQILVTSYVYTHL